jgi:hypothetical protein
MQQARRRVVLWIILFKVVFRSNLWISISKELFEEHCCSIVRIGITSQQNYSVTKSNLIIALLFANPGVD